MTTNKILKTLGDLIRRTAFLMFKLCGMFLSLCWQAFLADTSKTGTTTECPYDKEMREYYECAAEHNFKEGWGP